MNENLPLILQISLGLLLIFMLVAAYLGSRSWRWHHLTLVVLVFISAVVFCWLSAFTLRAHQAWRSISNQFDVAIAKEKETMGKLVDGELAEVNQQNECLRSVKRELERLTFTRGRVWRACAVAASSETSVELNLASPLTLETPEEPDAPAPAETPPAEGAKEEGNAAADNAAEGKAAEGEPAAEAPKAEPPAEGAAPEKEGESKKAPITALGFNIDKADEKKLIVQAFKEDVISSYGPPDAKLPILYLGEYVVDSVKVAPAAGEGAVGTQVSLVLKPRLPLDAVQAQAVADRTASWVLYEVMPIDNHEVFAELKPDEFNALFSEERFPIAKENPKQFESIITEYKHTGEEATASDPPERVWRRIKFKKELEMRTDFQSPNAKDKDNAAGPQDPGSGAPSFDPFTERTFDSQGLALAPHLWLGEVAKIQPGSTTIAAFPPGSDGADYPKDIEALIAKGVCEPADKPFKVYYRELRDYRHRFHHILFRVSEVGQEMVQIEADLARLKAAHDLCDNQVTFRQEEQTKLASDQQNVLRDNQALLAHSKALDAKLAEVKEKAKSAFAANQQMAADLARIQQQLVDRINAATGPDEAEKPKSPAIPLPSQAF